MPPKERALEPDLGNDDDNLANERDGIGKDSRSRSRVDSPQERNNQDIQLRNIRTMDSVAAQASSSTGSGRAGLDVPTVPLPDAPRQASGEYGVLGVMAPGQEHYNESTFSAPEQTQNYAETSLADTVRIARATGEPVDPVVNKQQVDRSARTKALGEQAGKNAGSKNAARDELAAMKTGRDRARVVAAMAGVLGMAGAAVLGTLYGLLLAAQKRDEDEAAAPFKVSPFKASGFGFGTAARADVLSSNSGYAPASLAIVGADPTTGKRVVPNEGTWSIDGASWVVFTPDQGFSGDPTPQKYSLTALKDGAKGEATAELIYDGDFRVGSILQTTFIKGQSTVVSFLKNSVGADSSTARLKGADPNTDDQTKTVVGQGVWLLDRNLSTITFNPEKGFLNEPESIFFTVASKTGQRTAEAFIALRDKQFVVADQIIKADPGKAISVTLFSVPGAVIDPLSLKFDGSASAGTLTVTNEGIWTIDAQGKLAFAPSASFKQMPSPVRLTVADTLGRRSPSFQLKAIPFAPPLALNDVHQTSKTLALMGGTQIRCNAAVDAIRIDFDIDLQSAQILALMPYDDSLPDAHWVTRNIELSVDGEGSWKVNPDGTITFSFAANPVRWPTPIAYSVKDVEGHESNLALVWITPREAADVDKALAGVNGSTDAVFWTRYHDNVLAQQITLGEVLSATYLIEGSTALAVSGRTLALINMIPVMDSATIDGTTMTWASKYGAAVTRLADVTAFIDDTYVSTQAAKRSGLVIDMATIPLATRIIRLRMIEALLTKIIGK